VSTQADYCMRIDTTWTLDAAERASDDSSFSACFLNHSRMRWNVRRRTHRKERRVALFAARTIAVGVPQLECAASHRRLAWDSLAVITYQEGEELLLDYGSTYWRGREDQEIV
jgi:hypothetical protein